MCMQSFFVIGNFVPITKKRSEKNELRESENSGWIFWRKCSNLCKDAH